jgi:hypothetical protein
VHRGDARLARNLLEIVKLLLTRGADHSAPFYFEGEWPLRPLYFACGRSDNPAIAELLIEAGADPCDGESVYHAADDGHVECLAVIERLTDAKRLADECSMCLCNQMHWGRVRGMPWLLEHGADPNWVSPVYHTTALREAHRLKKPAAVIQMLLSHGKTSVRTGKKARKSAATRTRHTM